MIVAGIASLACALTWAFASVVFGRAMQRVPDASPAALNFLKCAVSFPPLVVAGLVLGDGVPDTAGHGVGLFVSAALGLAVADSGYFVALKHLGIARGVLFIPLVPVATAVLAGVFLGEPSGSAVIAGIALVLGGILLVVARRDPEAGRHRGVVAGVAGGFTYAGAQAVANVLMKQAVVDAPATHVAALRIGFGAATLAVLVLFDGGPRALRPFLRRDTLPLLLLASFIGTFGGMWLGTIGAKGLPVGVATTLAATTPVWALMLAQFTGEHVTKRAVLGAVVAILGVVVLATSMTE